MSVDSMALSSEAQQLFEAAMRLPEIERAKLADKLAMTLDPMANTEWRAAWEPEIARRVAEVDNGTARLVDWEDLRRELMESISTATGPKDAQSSEGTDWDVLSAEGERLFEIAGSLTEDQRARLADLLYISVELGADAHDSFVATIGRRLAEIEEGTAKLYSWDELQQMMREARNSRRKV
ncbi:MAG TPA: addiction module protein [Pirellulales bacterium]|jgi:hypothetical protein|nr:addiction module protein [Pirellulales bacterium]